METSKTGASSLHWRGGAFFGEGAPSFVRNLWVCRNRGWRETRAAGFAGIAGGARALVGISHSVAHLGKSPEGFAGIANSAGVFAEFRHTVAKLGKRAGELAGIRHTEAKSSKRPRTVRKVSKRRSQQTPLRRSLVCVLSPRAPVGPQAASREVSERGERGVACGSTCTRRVNNPCSSQ